MGPFLALFSLKASSFEEFIVGLKSLSKNLAEELVKFERVWLKTRNREVIWAQYFQQLKTMHSMKSEISFPSKVVADEDVVVQNLKSENKSQKEMWMKKE